MHVLCSPRIYPGPPVLHRVVYKKRTSLIKEGEVRAVSDEGRNTTYNHKIRSSEHSYYYMKPRRVVIYGTEEQEHLHTYTHKLFYISPCAIKKGIISLSLSQSPVSEKGRGESAR